LFSFNQDRDLLDDSIVMVERLLQQVRQLSLELRPPLLEDLGLVPALHWHLGQQAQRALLRVEFFADPALERVDASIETACFRVAQEALTNVVRTNGERRTASGAGGPAPGGAGRRDRF
jgi:signal transduction histidine kinase